MPTALVEWTTERPNEPGFYWWREREGAIAEVVWLHSVEPPHWSVYKESDMDPAYAPDSLWWPVRIDVPPVG